MKIHDVKSWSHFFDAIKGGWKKHDLRDMERGYEVGDIIILNRYDNIKGEYTGERLEVRITYITSEQVPCAYSSAVLKRGYCILSLEIIRDDK